MITLGVAVDLDNERFYFSRTVNGSGEWISPDPEHYPESIRLHGTRAGLMLVASGLGCGGKAKFNLGERDWALKQNPTGPEVYKALRDAGVGDSPAMVAMSKGHERTAQILCGIGNRNEILDDKNLRATDAENGRTLLHYAAYFGAIVLAKDLVDACPKLLNAKDKYGHRPVEYALERGHTKIVQQLAKVDGFDPPNVPTRQAPDGLQLWLKVPLEKLDWSEQHVTQDAAQREGKKLSDIELLGGLPLQRLALRGLPAPKQVDWEHLAAAVHLNKTLTWVDVTGNKMGSAYKKVVDAFEGNNCVLTMCGIELNKDKTLDFASWIFGEQADAGRTRSSHGSLARTPRMDPSSVSLLAKELLMGRGSILETVELDLRNNDITGGDKNSECPKL